MTSTPEDVETQAAVEEVELEPDDVALPDSAEFDDSHELLTGEDADPPPGANAG
jgi:hypothetical protein